MSDMPPVDAGLPAWADELAALYQSGAASQFILYGNVADRMLLPLGERSRLGMLPEFLQQVLMPCFDVILSYDLGNSIRIEKGREIFCEWPRVQREPDFPASPRPAIEMLTHYFRYAANLSRLGGRRLQIGCYVRAADHVAPAFEGGLSHDLSALALLMRGWSSDAFLTETSLATFLITENLNDLHPLLANNPHAARIKIDLPDACELARAFRVMTPSFPAALEAFAGDPEIPARQLSGASLSAVESMLKEKEYRAATVAADDIVTLKKSLVENDCNGLIEFIESDQSMDVLYGQEMVKAWLRQDIELWNRNDTRAMPMGYLLCGPVGTGKTFMVKCLAGEAGVPVVKLKNFRDKWVGSTEGNLERIFRLLHALDRCYVFVDEADQALGKRDSAGNDSGLSGRIYSMIAEEMSNTRNRGRIVWILASSRPDLIEVDLKRPGRVDVKIPLFPTTSPEEGFRLIRALCGRLELGLVEEDFSAFESQIPSLLTPGAAEAISVKAYRLAVTQDLSPAEAVRECLTGYQNPIPRATMDFQIRIAVEEASDMDFVPDVFRHA